MHPSLDAALVERAFASAMQHRGGVLNLVVPTAIGAHVFVRRPEKIGDATVQEVLGRLAALACSLPSGLAA